MFNYDEKTFEEFKKVFNVKAEEAVELYEIFYRRIEVSPVFKSLSCDKLYDMFYEICWSVNELSKKQKKLDVETFPYNGMDSPDYIA